MSSKSNNGPFGKVVIGPMSGITTVGYRGFLGRFGEVTAVTEMVSSQGLIHDPEGSFRFVKAADGQPTGIQVFGSEPGSVADGAVSALGLEPKASFIDINMGCPASKVIRTGAGSALMRDPGLCGSLVSTVKDAVKVPVTVKMRSGIDKDSINFRQVIEEVIDAGVDAITIHPRTADRGYSGRADYDIIRGLGDELSVPLVVSGDIYSAEDAARAMESSGASGVMVARGCVGNPFLITQIISYIETGVIPETPTIGQQSDWCLELMDVVIEESGEEVAAGRMRAIAPKFLAGCRYSRDYRRALTKSGATVQDMIRTLEHAKREIGHMVPEPRRPSLRASRCWIPHPLRSV